MIAAVESAPVPARGVDWLGFLRRTQQAIDILRRSHIDGFMLDEEKAIRTLRFLKSRASGGPHDDEEEQATIEFIYAHGMSLDWLVYGDPRSMICDLAAHSPRGGSA